MVDSKASPSSERSSLAPIAAGVSLGALFLAAVGIPLDAAAELGLPNEQASAWILVVWGFPAVLTIVFSVRYREPLVLTGNIFILIFVLLLGGELSWAELVGATMTAGAIVIVLGLSGLTHRLALLLPPAIVYGVLAGAVLGLLADAFTALGSSTLLVGVTFGAYVLSRALVHERVPALLVAAVVGVVVAVVASKTGPVPAPAWPEVTLTMPTFTLEALATATPVLIVFITLQANAPSMVFLQNQGYQAPERTLALTSGIGTLLGSVFGPMGVSLSLPSAAITAGPDAGAQDVRYRAAVVAAVISIGVALTAGFATEVIEFVPPTLLDAVVGLAVLGILAGALKEMTSGPLNLGPVVAFAVSVSRIELFGLGRFFWALVLGVLVSIVLERSAWLGMLHPHAEDPGP